MILRSGVIDCISRFCLIVKLIRFLSVLILLPGIALCQSQEKQELPKIRHAEPLYIDLIRDLGTRKGEREWNVGAGLTDNLTHDEYEFLVEYEFAAWDRIGIEFEIPLLIYSQKDPAAPSNRIEAFQAATQWTFLVDPQKNISLAAGYLNGLLVTPFEDGPSPFFKGNLFNPFFVGAKRLGQNWHSLIYTGPQFEYFFEDKKWENEYELHLSFHYLVPGTDNFVGLELNHFFRSGKADITMRPQLRLDISDNILIGMVTGIPLTNSEERMSFFMRLIWEPEDHL